MLINLFIYLPFKYTTLYTFQQPASTLMLGIIDLHHTIMFYLIVIFFLVFWLLCAILFLKYEYSSYFRHCPLLEIIWTCFPSIIILAILLPSLSLLHTSEQFTDPGITLKVVGHQWYWSYEYSDYNTKDLTLYTPSINSNIKSNWVNMIAEPIIFLPVRTVIRFLVTSEDVIHSWAIPAWGVKIDAIPGRLNQVIISLYRSGLYYGQCSELCGIGHGFMPITIEVVPMINFLEWFYFKNLSQIEPYNIPYSNDGSNEYIHYNYYGIFSLNPSADDFIRVGVLPESILSDICPPPVMSDFLKHYYETEDPGYLKNVDNDIDFVKGLLLEHIIATEPDGSLVKFRDNEILQSYFRNNSLLGSLRESSNDIDFVKGLLIEQFCYEDLIKK